MRPKDAYSGNSEWHLLLAMILHYQTLIVLTDKPFWPLHRGSWTCRGIFEYYFLRTDILRTSSSSKESKGMNNQEQSDMRRSKIASFVKISIYTSDTIRTIFASIDSRIENIWNFVSVSRPHLDIGQHFCLDICL